MKHNIGTLDRLLRLSLGLVAFAAAVYAYFRLNGLLAAVLAAIGLFCVFEAVIGWCAVYALLGRNTCPID